jgi:hypothetical protein
MKIYQRGNNEVEISMENYLSGFGGNKSMFPLDYEYDLAAVDIHEFYKELGEYLKDVQPSND